MEGKLSRRVENTLRMIKGHCFERRKGKDINKLASLEATLVETTTHPLTDGGEV